MPDENYSYLKNSSHSSWEITFETDFNKIEKQINNKLWQLNLTKCCTIEQVKNEVFLLITNQIFKQKLKYQVIDNSGVFLKIKPDGITEPIRNFKAWLRTVSFNHIKQTRIKQNKHDKIININDCYYLHDKKNPEQYILKIELREKLKELGDEERRILEMRHFEGFTYKEICLSLESEGYPKYTEINLRKKKERAEEKLRKFYQL